MRLLTMMTLLLLPLCVRADEEKNEKKKGNPLELTIVLKSDSIAWDADETKRKEFKEALEVAEKESKKKPPVRIKLPPQPEFAASIDIKNISDKDVSILVAGDANLLTLDLKGPGVFKFTPPRAMTREFRGSRTVTLKPGERFEMPIKKLSDGLRGITRDIYWSELGEYTLTASYSIGEGDSNVILKSEPVKFKVVEKK